MSIWILAAAGRIGELRFGASIADIVRAFGEPDDRLASDPSALIKYGEQVAAVSLCTQVGAHAGSLEGTGVSTFTRPANANREHPLQARASQLGPSR